MWRGRDRGSWKKLIKLHKVGDVNHSLHVSQPLFYSEKCPPCTIQLLSFLKELSARSPVILSENMELKLEVERFTQHSDTLNIGHDIHKLEYF